MSKQDKIIENVLKGTGFKSLNPLQEETLKLAGDKRNLLILSQTGSGKTLAFFLAILSELDKEKKHIQCVIIAPTRELAVQIENVFRSLKTDFKVLACYGGHSMKVETNSLTQSPAVLIGTPGRICDHIHRENLVLSRTNILVIDEYDKCLEFGFEDQMKYIREEMYKTDRTILVSATELKEYPDYLNFKDPGIVNYLESSETPKIEYFNVPYKSDNKLETLYNLLCSFEGELTIVFCNFREATATIKDYLDQMGYDSIIYHGGLEQEERERALIKFRNGSSHTLICTDLGSRGLDIPEIQHVVHFQYPHGQEAYIHRNGRTARMKANGSAYLMIDQSEEIPEYLDVPKNKTIIKKSYPVKSEMVTLYFSGGKKDKINKIDLVGFLGQKGQLKKEEIGLITVLDYSSFVAVKREGVRNLLNIIRDEKIKGKKLKIAVAK